MSRYVSPCSRRSSASRLRICACTETSSAEVGSSSTSSLRPQGEGAGDRDALALPARQLVRPAGHVDAREPDLVQQRGHPRLDAPASSSRRCVRSGSATTSLTRDARVERADRVLEHDLHLASQARAARRRARW